MAHEILTVKLCEMDETIGRLHCRIHLSRDGQVYSTVPGDWDDQPEYAETELALRKKLKYSHSKMVSLLAGNYEEIEQIIQKSKADMEQLAEMSGSQTPLQKKHPIGRVCTGFCHASREPGAAVLPGGH